MDIKTSYEQAREILRLKSYDRPKIIQFETTNNCNARCVFCPHSKMARKKGFMSDQTFEKLLSEIKQIRPNIIICHLHGEPFMDEKIIERLELIQKNFPEPIKAISTNGSLLDNDKIDSLLKLTPLHITVSLNATNPEDHEKITGLNNFEIVKRNVTYLLELRKKRDFRLSISMISYSPHAYSLTKEFKKSWGENAAVWFYDNYAGLKYPAEQRENVCTNSICTACILWNGDVSLCCKDMEGKVIFGNINEKSLYDIWNSDLAVKYHFSNINKRFDLLELCQNCNYHKK